MASIAAAGAAAAAIGVWYSQRKAPQLSEFTEPPKTWGDAVLRLHEVVRVSWKEALSKLGIWRLDHLLAIRHLSSRDLSVEIAEEIKAHGVLVEVRATRAPSSPRARPFAEFADGTAPSARSKHAFVSRGLSDASPLPLPAPLAQGGADWSSRLEFIDMAMRYNRLLRGARSVEQIVAKLDPSRADILLSQLRPAILQPAYILFRDRVERRLFFVIRGTHSVRDTVTSLTAHPRPHHAIGADGVPVLGHAHAGFLSTARWLAKNTRDDLAAALASNPGFELTVVGHSLGAGTAVLLTQLLRELEGGDRARNPFADVECLAFACPSCLSKELSESCRPFITTLVSNADVVPLVSFSKVSELQAQIVSAAWEQQVLKKWRETTRAMSAACAAPREGRAAAGAAASSRARFATGFPLLGRGLGGLPGSLTCGLGGPPRHARGGSESLGVDFDDAARGAALEAGGMAHLPGAVGGAPGARPRRWLGAQMRSLRRAMGAGEGNKLAKLASISGALIAGCVAPRKPGARLDLEGARLEGARGQSSSADESSTSASTPPSSAEMTWPRSAPTASATAAVEAAAATGTGTGTGRPGEDAMPSWSRDLAADLALDLDDADADDAAIFSALEGEAAQEVLKLQEELSVIQAAEERLVRGRERKRRVEDATRGSGTSRTFGASGEIREGDEVELAVGGAATARRYPSSDEEDAFEEEDEAEGRAPLPEPLATKEDPVALLGPGAPAEAMAAAAELAVTEALERARDEDEDEGDGDGDGDDDAAAVDLATLAERVAVGKGGSNWGPDAAGPSSSSAGATSPDAAGGAARTHDDSAFKVKLYPAGRILHMVLTPPAESRDPARAEDDGETAAISGGTAAISGVGSGSDGARRRYELYADVNLAAYDRIRLSKTMLSDHFLPKYLEALEDVREGLAQRDAARGE